jgi:N-terminal half of MaoC dehydratase
MSAERFPVEATHILMFARAIGDPNPAYAEADSAEAKKVGGIVAPPTFAMAGSQFDPDNPLRWKPGEPWFGSGREPSGATRDSGGGGGATLHAEQHFEYHQPMRPGMVLTATDREGKEWEKESKRGGKLFFFERIMEYRDRETGEPVVTLRMVGVRPETIPEKGA